MNNFIQEIADLQDEVNDVFGMREALKNNLLTVLQMCLDSLQYEDQYPAIRNALKTVRVRIDDELDGVYDVNQIFEQHT